MIELKTLEGRSERPLLPRRKDKPEKTGKKISSKSSSMKKRRCEKCGAILTNENVIKIKIEEAHGRRCLFPCAPVASPNTYEN